MSKYAIWNKKDAIITPVGEVFTAEQWMERYPVARLENITIVCGGGEINGAYFGTLGQMVSVYEQQGCDFSQCTTAEEELAAIEAFETAMGNVSGPPSAEERIAAALEYQVLAALPDTK